MGRKTRGLLSALLVVALALLVVLGMGTTAYAFDPDTAESWSTDQSITDITVIDNGVILENSISLSIAEGKTLTVNNTIWSRDGAAKL